MMVNIWSVSNLCEYIFWYKCEIFEVSIYDSKSVKDFCGQFQNQSLTLKMKRKAHNLSDLKVIS